MSDSRILITGGAGFIGSNLVRGALKSGYSVRVIDDLSTGKLSNLSEVMEKIDFIEGDILDQDLLNKAARGVSHVLHHAAQVSVPRSIEDPLHNDRVNGTGTLRVLEAARLSGVKRVVYAASCAIYGNDPTLPKREDQPIEPLSPYAVSKYMGEVYGACYEETMGLEVVALRYFNVFGPRQDAAGGYAAVIPIFISRLLQGQAPIVHGDGLQTRDFVHVDNVVAANLKALTAADASGKVFNIGTGEETSILQLAETLVDIMGVQTEVIRTEARLGDVRRSVADISRAKDTLGYDVNVHMRDGLERTVAWYGETR